MHLFPRRPTTRLQKLIHRHTIKNAPLSIRNSFLLCQFILDDGFGCRCASVIADFIFAVFVFVAFLDFTIFEDFGEVLGLEFLGRFGGAASGHCGGDGVVVVWENGKFCNEKIDRR
jgi:hypothetical protein